MREATASARTRDGTMPVHLFVPDDVAACPGLVVYMDAFGIREELFDICRRYATAGYAVLLPDLYHRLGCPRFAPTNRQDEPLPIGMQDANRATTVAMTASRPSARDPKRARALARLPQDTVPRMHLDLRVVNSPDARQRSGAVPQRWTSLTAKERHAGG